MPDRDRFNMTLPSDQKERWEGYVNESPEINSLSQLVRLAVEQEVREGGDSTSGTADSDVSERLSEVLENNRQLSSRLQGIEARLGSIEQAVQEDPEISKLANEVFRVLPTQEQIKGYLSDGRGAVVHLENEHGKIDLAYKGSVGHIANVLDEEELRVQQALDKLQDDTARVHTLKPHEEVTVYPTQEESNFDPDEVRWYKEV